jgi:hypothetical protein
VWALQFLYVRPSNSAIPPCRPEELDLIALTGFTAFPPRLEGQPIFYPVLNEEYASFIAREWNTVDAASGYVGYVLRFSVDSAYLRRFDVQKVGSASALEYWIPAEQLDEFNSNIIGKIELISAFRPEDRYSSLQNHIIGNFRAVDWLCGGSVERTRG